LSHWSKEHENAMFKKIMLAVNVLLPNLLNLHFWGCQSLKMQ